MGLYQTLCKYHGVGDKNIQFIMMSFKKLTGQI